MTTTKVAADEIGSARCRRASLREYAEEWRDEPQQRLGVLVLACDRLRKAHHPWSCACGWCVPSKWRELLFDLAEYQVIRDGLVTYADTDEDDARERVEYGLDVLTYGPARWEREAA